MEPTTIVIISDIASAIICFVIGGMTTYAGYIIFHKKYGGNSSKLELKLWAFEAKVDNVGGVIMISGLAWGVLGYEALPNLDYSVDNGYSQSMIAMAPPPLNANAYVSYPHEFWEFNKEMFDVFKSYINENSSKSSPARIYMDVEHTGSGGITEIELAEGYVLPVIKFCKEDLKGLCNVEVTFKPGLEDTDSSIPFTPEAIGLYIDPY